MHLALLLLLAPTAGPDTWRDLQQMGLTAMQEGSFARAAKHFRDARDKLDDRTDSAAYARLLHNEGTALQQAGDSSTARVRLLQALKAWDKASGVPRADIASTHNSLAILFRQQWDLARAERHAGLAVELNPSAAAWHTLAEIHRMAGHWEQAAFALDQAGQLLEASPDAVICANVLQARAGLLADQDRPQEAEPLFRNAARALTAALGADHPATLAANNNVAGVLLALRRYDEAAPQLVELLAACERVLGPDHPRSAVAANNLAQLLRAQKRYAEAEPLYRHALAILAARFGEDNPEYARALHNLGSLFAEQGKLRGAGKLYRQAMEIAERTLGPDHPQTIKHQTGLTSLKPASH